MKFTHSLSGLVFFLPLLAQVNASPFGGFNNGGFGGNFGGKAGNNAGKGGAAAAKSTDAAASTAAANTAAAAAASSAAAATSVASAAASTASAAADSGDAQSSLTLDPSVIATGFENNGQDVPEAGQVASLTSSNNFINFCATVPNLPITNGQQIKTGSCNPAPMGIIAAQTNMPSSKFSVPVNGQNFGQNQSFTITMAIQNLDTGFFVNANENYFSAPQQVGSSGNIQGHSHVVIEQVKSFTDTTPTDPTKFAFFKGLNAAAVGGVLTADVTDGLLDGVYRLASINTAANHQPALVAVAQHGAMDDMVYFSVGNAAAAGNPFGGSGAAASAAGAAASASAAGAGTAASAAGAAASTSAAAAGAAKSAAPPAAKGGNQGNKGGNNAQGGRGGKPFKLRRESKNRL
ncbi:hypothetical protein PsYK624_103880 [Phanerochaete sordida]|uniref:Uncharacterized protein n=1 Tax=Phanerochaete sordida TaxID=48140 RepID=A0A9P3GFZ9_9APHY|nr:hypothetical protein PsYK624_103880 [Phanerochaete sordida]